MRIIKMYSYLMKPTKKQKDCIQNIYKNITIIHNQYVMDKKENKDINRLAKDILKEYKAKFVELNNTDSSALINELFKLGDIKSEEIKFSRKRHSYTTSRLKYADSFYLRDNYVYLPKVGKVRIVKHREIPDDCRELSVTIHEDKTNAYYAIITVEKYIQFDENKINYNKSIGLDYSSPYFFVDSKGRKANIPAFYRKQEGRIDELKRKLWRQEKGSEAYYKTKYKLDKVNKRIANQRKDWLHKISSDLVKNYDVICLESLSMEEIAKNGSLSKATYDNSYGLFKKMLEYKTRENGKKLVYVDKWFPSSKQCSVCGNVNSKLKLHEREWICPKCGAFLDRDINAAKNIENEGKRLLELHTKG